MSGENSFTINELSGAPVTMATKITTYQARKDIVI